MTDHRMVGSELVPFGASFRWRKASGHSRALSSDWTVPTSVVVVVFVPQRSEALVHVAEATSIVAEATTLISIYDGKNILSRLTSDPQYVIYWLSQIIIIGGAL